MVPESKVTYKGSVYYVGNEVVLDANHRVIGWFASRGKQVIVTAVEDNEEIARMVVTTTRTIFETEGESLSQQSTFSASN